MPPGGLHPRMVAWEVPGGSSSPSGLPQSFIFPRRPLNAWGSLVPQ